MEAKAVVVILALACAQIPSAALELDTINSTYSRVDNVDDFPYTTEVYNENFNSIVLGVIVGEKAVLAPACNMNESHNIAGNWKVYPFALNRNVGFTCKDLYKQNGLALFVTRIAITGNKVTAALLPTKRATHADELWTLGLRDYAGLNRHFEQMQEVKFYPAGDDLRDMLLHKKNRSVLPNEVCAGPLTPRVLEEDGNFGNRSTFGLFNDNSNNHQIVGLYTCTFIEVIEVLDFLECFASVYENVEWIENKIDNSNEEYN